MLKTKSIEITVQSKISGTKFESPVHAFSAQEFGINEKSIKQNVKKFLCDEWNSNFSSIKYFSIFK